jgi:hypothetical protein
MGMPIVIVMETERDLDAPPKDAIQEALSVPDHIKGTKWEPLFFEMHRPYVE